jgi:hypothetical protein
MKYILVRSASTAMMTPHPNRLLAPYSHDHSNTNGLEIDT